MSGAHESDGSRPEYGSGLHIVALCGFAIAQPIFDLLGRHGEFFVSRAAGPSEIVGLALGLIALPPLVATALLWGARSISPRWGRGVDLALVATLLATTALPPLLRATALPEIASVALAIASGAAGAAAYARFGRFRSALRVLAIAPLVFAVLFLARGDIRKLVLPTTAVAVHDAYVTGDTPVVLVIFDELPLASLLAADGAIDPVRYPAFARFAADSTWFRHASAVSSRTNLAVPAILTGRYPPLARRLPIQVDHPENLFSLLGDAYALNVFETETQLHHARDDRAGAAREAGDARGLASDIAILYTHMLLPSALRELLPSVSETWGGFGGRVVSALEPNTRDDLARSRARKRHRAAADAAAFERFIASIRPRPDGQRRVLHFLHVTLPHGDWKLLADGRSYAPDQRYGFVDGRWLDTPWWSTDAWRRHLLQLAYTDRLLGRLLDRLESSNLYDSALVLLTADHGASFWPGGSFRKPGKTPHPEDLLSVPLLVKLPHQRSPAVDDRFAESVDLLPTIAATLGTNVPWQLDGCSLYATACPERATRRLYIEELYRNPRVLHFDRDIVGSDATLRRKLELFGADDATVGLFRAGFGAGIVDRPVTTFPQRPEFAGSVRFGPTMRGVLAGKIPGRVAARIVGLLDLDEPPQRIARVAVAIDGIVRAVVPAPHDGVHGLRIAALLPPDAIPVTADALTLHLVVEAPGEISLRPLAIR